MNREADSPEGVYDAGNAFDALAEHRDADHCVPDSLSPEFSTIRHEKMVFPKFFSGGESHTKARPYFFIFLCRVTRLMPSCWAARARF